MIYELVLLTLMSLILNIVVLKTLITHFIIVFYYYSLLAYLNIRMCFSIANNSCHYVGALPFFKGKGDSMIL